MLEKLHIYVCIIAAVVVSAVSILDELSLQDMAIRLIGTIVVFYFIGLIVRAYLKKYVFAKPEEPEEAGPANTDEEETPQDETAE
jgi:hypothetical protein